MPLSLRDAGYLWDILEAARARSKPRASWIKRARSRTAWFKPQWNAGQRNLLAHEYREVRQEKLWRVAREELPRLVAELTPELPPPPRVE